MTYLTNAQQTFVDNYSFGDPRSEELARFRQDYRLEELVATGSELDKLLRLTDWTCGQFHLFGRPSIKTEHAREILEACAVGHTFYCAHYVVVFCAAANALGWVARPISLRRAAEQPRWSNHNVAEVWSRERRRWLCFDPAWGGCMAIAGEPVCAYEVGREEFTREGRDLQAIIGTQRHVISRHEMPNDLRHYPEQGWRAVAGKGIECYACLAWIPTNRLLQRYDGKSIERWDDWKNIYVYMGAERGWREAPEDLPPYYPVG